VLTGAIPESPGHPPSFDPIDLEAYRVAKATRDLEINLFWQRSNYFLGLSAGIAAAFFSLKDSTYPLPLAIFGLFVALLWVAINLGSKFWQSRWEHRLRITEENLRPGMNLFSASWETVQEDVRQSFEFRKRGPIYSVYARLVLLKPSVTFVMTFLSLLFVLFWTALLVPIFGSTQNDSQSVRQADKSSDDRQNLDREKKAVQTAAPKQANDEVDEPTFNYNQSYASENTRPVRSWIDSLNALSTAVVGAFTVLLAIVAYRQYLATRIAERAWVVCQPPNPLPTYVGGDVAIRWEVENRGRTPAWITALGSAARIIKIGDALPVEPPYTMAGPFTSDGTVLPPNAKASRGVTIPAPQMAAVEHGHEGKEYALYVFGIVRYRDTFRSEHETRYCFRFKTGPTEDDPAPRDFYVDGPTIYTRAT
jgi:hypothetical protein